MTIRYSTYLLLWAALVFSPFGAATTLGSEWVVLGKGCLQEPEKGEEKPQEKQPESKEKSEPQEKKSPSDDSSGTDKPAKDQSKSKPGEKDASPDPQEPSAKDKKTEGKGKGKTGDDDAAQDEKKPAKKPAKKKEDGTPDLLEAYDLKIEYRNTRDLDRILQLCEEALSKELSEKDRSDAIDFLAECTVEFAQAFADQVFRKGDMDVRWQYYRSLAVPKLARAVKLKETAVPAHLLLARLQALPGGDKAQAARSVSKVLEFSKDDQQKSLAYFIRASLSSDNKAKLKDLNQALKANPDNLDALLIRAEHFVARGRMSRAVQDYRNWLDAQPENWEARIRVAQSLKDTGAAFNEEVQGIAVEILDEAIELKEDSTVAYTMKAEVLLLSKKYEEVVDATSKAIELEPKNILALRMRAGALADLKRYEQAIEDADAIVDLQGRSLDGVELRGLIRMQQGDLTEAIKDFEQLSKANPTDYRMKEHLASLYNANDQPTKAIKIYRNLLRRVRETVWEDRDVDVKLAMMQQRATLLRGRGDAHLSCSKHSEAVADFEESMALHQQINEIEKENNLKLTPPDEVVLNNLAWVLATSPDDDVRDGKRAIELATQSAELTEYKQAYILSTLASGYAEIGDFDAASEWIEKALVLNRAAAEKADDPSDTDRQFKSLNKELDSYRAKKPWRESQDVENKKKEDGAEEDKGENGAKDKAGEDNA